MKRKSAVALGITAAAFALLLTQVAPARAAGSTDTSATYGPYPTQGLTLISLADAQVVEGNAKSAASWESAAAPVIHSQGSNIGYAVEYADYWNGETSGAHGTGQ